MSKHLPKGFWLITPIKPAPMLAQLRDMVFAWFVWERDHDGPAIIDRISWAR